MSKLAGNFWHTLSILTEICATRPMLYQLLTLSHCSEVVYWLIWESTKLSGSVAIWSAKCCLMQILSTIRKSLNCVSLSSAKVKQWSVTAHESSGADYWQLSSLGDQNNNHNWSMIHVDDDPIQQKLLTSAAFAFHQMEDFGRMQIPRSDNHRSLVINCLAYLPVMCLH